MSTFLIAEDDPLHRGFLREVLGQCDIGTYRLVEVDNGDDAIREITDQEARGVILDLQMPRQTGVQVARWIWARAPATPILFWSNYADEAYVRGISRIVPANTAYGYLLKSASRDRLSRAITCVFVDGQNIIDREVRSVQERRNTRTTSLTETEYEVLLDIAIGLTDHAIAERRHISLRSVQGHVRVHGDASGDQRTVADAEVDRSPTGSGVTTRKSKFGMPSRRCGSSPTQASNGACPMRLRQAARPATESRLLAMNSRRRIVFMPRLRVGAA